MIFIPGNIPSLKNSKIKTAHGVFSSKTVKKFLNNLGIQSYSVRKKIIKGYVNKPNYFEELRSQFEEALENKEYPILVSFHFVRDTKRLFDFGNATELIFDLLTSHDIIPDDNVSYVFPSVMTIDGILPNETNMNQLQWYSVDKNNSGVYIKIN